MPTLRKGQLVEGTMYRLESIYFVYSGPKNEGVINTLFSCSIDNDAFVHPHSLYVSDTSEFSELEDWEVSKVLSSLRHNGYRYRDGCLIYVGMPRYYEAYIRKLDSDYNVIKTIRKFYGITFDMILAESHKQIREMAGHDINDENVDKDSGYNYIEFYSETENSICRIDINRNTQHN